VNDRDVIRSLETVSNGKVVFLLVLVAAAVVGLIAFVASGFRGKDVSGSAEAVTEPAIPSPSR
jgi:hypothetical protein